MRQRKEDIQKITLTNPELSKEIDPNEELKIRHRHGRRASDLVKTGFWKAIVKDTNDIYSLSTALYVFIVILPIVSYEIKKAEPRYIDFKVWNYSLGEIPMALQIVLVSVILTTIVNYFRMILSLGMSYLKGKLNKDKENGDGKD